MTGHDRELAALAAVHDTLLCGQLLDALATRGARTLPELAQALAYSRAEVQAGLEALARAGRAVRCVQGVHAYWRVAPSLALYCAGGAVAADAVSARWRRPALQPLKRARSCYGHLAGELGVAQLLSLRQRGLLVQEGTALRLTDVGQSWLASLGVALPPGRRVLAKPCLDWSERQDHLGGWLGRALLNAWLARGWLRAGTAPRSLVLTARGRRELLPWLSAPAADP